MRIVYKDKDSSYEQLLHRDESFSIHERNLQTLAVEMYKVKHNLTPPFMHTLFPSTQNHYNIRNNPEFKTENVHTTYFGTETLTYRGPKIWEIVPREIKESSTLNEFKRKIKSWKLDGCRCRICRVYINNLGFL